MDHLFRQGDRREGCLSRCAFSSLLLFLLVVHTAFSYCYWNWYSGDLLSTQKRKALSSSRNNSGELPLRIILPSKFIIGPRSPYFLSKPMLLCTQHACFLAYVPSTHQYQHQHYIAISSLHCLGSFSSYGDMRSTTFSFQNPHFIQTQKMAIAIKSPVALQCVDGYIYNAGVHFQSFQQNENRLETHGS